MCKNLKGTILEYNNSKTDHTYANCGNLVQDVAAIRTLEELTNEYMHKYGYDDAVITTVFHQWMGGFPQDEAKAFGVISWGSATAALSKATKDRSS